MCVCVLSRKPRLAVDWRLLVEECIANIVQLLDFFWFFAVLMVIFGSLQTSRLCIMGELAGGGSLAVAFGVNNI